ncbi:hypothetical protein HYU13_06620 [Candidatus Woesearchaeota archaeon]|nr:hypothetical protein [Candidatus Woesearchaeota archaeon]
MEKRMVGDAGVIREYVLEESHASLTGLVSGQDQGQQSRYSQGQKFIVYALQQQLRALFLKEWLIVIAFSFIAATLRVPMQAIPSAEPITFFAILAGSLFGSGKGFFTGAAAGYLSNFAVMGGQGPWTPFQMLSWGIAGYLGGLMMPAVKYLQSTPKLKNLSLFFAYGTSMLAAASSTLIFDIIMNLSWTWYFPAGIIGTMLGGIPFFVIHLVSNVSFAFFIPLAEIDLGKRLI